MVDLKLSGTTSENVSFVDQVDTFIENEIDNLTESFSLSGCQKKITSFLTGVSAGVCLFIGLDQYGAIKRGLCNGSQFQGVIDIAIKITKLPLNLYGIALRVGFVALTSIIIPYVEELLFRGILHKILGAPEDGFLDRGFKVVYNAALFTAAHVPDFLPAINPAALAMIFILGLTFSTLRELSSDRVSCTAAHMTYNGLVFGSIFLLAKR